MMYLRSDPGREGAVGGSSSTLPVCANEAVAHVKLGSYYEIDHSSLPQRSPEQLRSIKIVMVNKITATHVLIRYPSMYSLRSYFGGVGMNRSRSKRGTGILPLLDESHVMESELAGEVLYRRIQPHELSTRRNSWSFWGSNMVGSSWKERTARLSCLSVSALKEKCLSELRSAGMINWGKRQRVQYQSRHIEEKKNEAREEDPTIKAEEQEEQIAKNEMEERDNGNETKGNDHRGEMTIDRRSSTRKRQPCELLSQRPAQRTKGTNHKKHNQIVGYNKKATKKFIDRWSVERYKLAENNMLKVMKEKNAVFSNPIPRVELRREARKLIGDTGLLDHLLKHMAGKVAPGDQERFRRRHNADGAMEYWLESSDLEDVRREAGVEDPYWTPPLGWKLGDNPTQDPLCANAIRDIRETLANLKGEMEKLTSKKQEDELAMANTPCSCVSSQTLDPDNLMEVYTNLLKRKDQIEQQLMIVSESLSK